MRRELVRPWLIVAVAAAITAASGVGLSRIKIEGGTVFLPASSPVEQRIKRMERVFGGSEIMSVMMSVDDPTIFTAPTLGLIRQITSELEALPGVAEVRSLANADYLQGAGGAMLVEKLMPDVPVTPVEVRRVYERAQSWEMYRGLFFSGDRRATQWIVTLRTGSPANQSAVVESVRKVALRHNGPGHHFMVTGEVAVKALLVSGITRDISFLLPILFVVLVGILFFAFRRPGGVLLPLATVVMSTMWTIGLMAAVGVPINIMGTAIPLLLVTVGSAYGIHFLSHYYEELGNCTVHGRSPDPGGSSGTAGVERTDHAQVVRSTLNRVGLPILLAGVTTIAGFGSLGSASVPAILQMGIFTAVGVLFALLLTFSFVPAVLALRAARPRRRIPKDRTTVAPRPNASSRDGTTARLLTAVYDLFAKRPALLFALVAVLFGLSFVGIARIQVGQPTVNFFRPASPIRSASRFADERFGGSTTMYVVVRSGEAAVASENGTTNASSIGSGRSAGTEGVFDAFGDLAQLKRPEARRRDGEPSLTDPTALQSLENLERHLTATYPAGVGRVSSLTTMIKQMNRVMHDGRPAYYEIPTDPKKYDLSDRGALRRLIAQYLLLYSGNLSSLLDSSDNPRELRLIVQLENSDPSFLKEIKREVVSYAGEHLARFGYAVETVGLPDEVLAMNDSIMKSQIASLSIALLCVFAAVAAAYRSLRIGLAGLVPIALSLMLNFATMGFLHIPLDIVTAIIASVAVGIGIDYSIHVVSAYVFEYRSTGDTQEAAHRTLSLTGRAIFYNVASVAVGFAVLVFSMFTPLNSLGILMGVIMLTSSFFSLTLLPVVLGAIVPHLKARRAFASRNGLGISR